MATGVDSKSALAANASSLNTESLSFKTLLDNIKSTLGSIKDIDGINLSAGASKLSSSADSVGEDLTTVITNISSYAEKLIQFDINDFGNGTGTGGLVQTSATTSTTIDLPSGLGSVHTYMGWQCITNKSSDQYKLREDAGMNFDSEGFAKIGDRYVVATTTTYGNVGDYIDVYQEDGSVIKCVIGDIKNQNDAGCNKWGHNNGKCVVEFVVDKDSWYNGHENPGTSSCHPEWNQNITKVVNTGSYWGGSSTVQATNLTATNAVTDSSNSSGNNKVTYTSYSSSRSSSSSSGSSSGTWYVGGSSGGSSSGSSSSGGDSPINATSVTISSGDPNIDVSKYHNNIEKGFEVTVGNKAYTLSDSDVELLCAIVAAESDKSYDDALAVITTILNRCETPAWIRSHGTDPVAQATAPNQFVVYQHGSYKRYMNGNAPETVQTAVKDALAGVRNHRYLSFRSNGTTSYSDNKITATGNRYKNLMPSSTQTV